MSAFVLFLSVTELQTKNKQHLGKQSTANFPTYLLLFTDWICPFVGKKASHNFMQKKDDKVGNKTGYKEKGKGKRKRAREKKSK